MPGPMPKPGALRQRRNRTSTHAVLFAKQPMRQRAPSLPCDRGWHRLTLAWWQDVWHSPMAAEFLSVDIHGLYRLAILIDRFWVEPTVNLASEIRQQQTAYGLTPIDRRRLQWEVERVESVARKRRPPLPATGNGDDPRNLLRIV